MMSEFVLYFDRQTDKKCRYAKVLSGVTFTFYIPKAELPDPFPGCVRVFVETDSKECQKADAYLRAVVRYVEECSNTIHYAPIGDSNTWQIGEPYVPKTALTQPWPKQLHIAVSWE